MDPNGLSMCMWRNRNRCYCCHYHWNCEPCTHSLMYFNALFTLTNSRSSNYVPFPHRRRKKLLADKFIHFIYAYIIRRDRINMCIKWKRDWEREREGAKSQEPKHKMRPMGCVQRTWANVIIVYQITNRKWVFECSSHVFVARFFVCVCLNVVGKPRWPQYKSRDMRSCGFVSTQCRIFILRDSTERISLTKLSESYYLSIR